MRIIIYGDCIVPPLDTLKRVVKAGDGTILATSPPYTRFLESDIDFAIVSPGMPHVDIWIQEFLRHEIPCVSADYLVEYVCKPGYSLDRHVQYNTHAWAEKSFKKLESHMNEIAEDMSPQKDNSIADIPCQVCGSCDRGEVMLICGNGGGSKGCGIGTHIDCCDPPLQEIPEEDCYCSKCSSKNTKKMPRKLILLVAGLIALFIIIWTQLDSFSSSSKFSKHEAGVTHVLVTGGAGFIGSNAVLRLLKDSYRVTIVDNLSRGNMGAVKVLQQLFPEPGKLQFIYANLGDAAVVEKNSQKMPLMQ